MDTGRQVCIYAKEITSRLSYTCFVLFGEKALVTDSRASFIASPGPRLNYSDEPTPGICQVIPVGLLSEKSIRTYPLSCSTWRGLPVFFNTPGDIPFDFFSAAFYLLSRYEEYLPHQEDRYGRYGHTNSLAYREGFLKLPLVNLWMQECLHYLQQAFPADVFPAPVHIFRFLPTYDVDIAYAYRGQPAWKNVAGFFRDMIKGDTQGVLERGNVYAGRARDPFDTFSWLDALHAKYRLRPAYFLQALIKKGAVDKNLPARSRHLQQLYQKLAAVYVTGLHPSWQSGTEEWLLLKEKETLEQIVHHNVFISRFHYLRFRLPHAYRRLTEAGIAADHSMGYADVNGFRASYALPYRWYDLERETMTQLVIHPFCFMEASAFFGQGYNAHQAGEELQYFHDTVKKVNGELVTLFHNHFLTEQPQWVQWREMYAAFLQRNFG